jgi:hypothetical protein
MTADRSQGGRRSARVATAAGRECDAVPVRSTDVSSGERDAGCVLCAAERITPWYHEDDVCWVADCEICATPMVVWRWHGIDPSDGDRQHMLARLATAAARVFDGHYVDGHMRNIPGHFHAHARPEGGFFGHGFRRDPPADGGAES